MNLIEVLQREADRSRDFVVELESTKTVVGGDQPGLDVSIAHHRSIARNADAAIASGDAALMVSLAQYRGQLS